MSTVSGLEIANNVEREWRDRLDAAVRADESLLRQALEALEFFAYMKSSSKNTNELITALRERLANPDQETVKFKCTVVDDDHPNGIPIQQWRNKSLCKQCICLTELEFRRLYVSTSDYKTLWESIEAKLLEKNA